jgi:putative Holliday junction resolvase
MGKILGLDFGEKKIGVAISDEIGMLARPLLTIIVNNKQLTADQIKKICEENQVQGIVIGLPKTMKGELDSQAEKVFQFVDGLKKVVNIPIVFEDERLTSRMVEKMLIVEGVKREKRNSIIDQLAAKTILQSYLDKKYKS